MTSNDRWELLKSAPCPCGRGRKYGKCCQPKGITWTRDAKGELWKSVPLSDQALEAFKDAEKEFERIYRRKARPTERIFPWSYITSDADLSDKLAEVLEKADVRPELKYATNKTGMILTTTNAHLFSAADLAEWDAAIAEYHDLVARGLLDRKDELDQAIGALEEEF